MSNISSVKEGVAKRYLLNWQKKIVWWLFLHGESPSSAGCFFIVPKIAWGYIQVESQLVY